MKPQEYLGTEYRQRRLDKGEDHVRVDANVHDVASIVRNGLIWLPAGSRPLTTPKLGTGRRVYIYAVSLDGTMRIAFDDGRFRNVAGAMKHETLFQGATVGAAGEIEAIDGVVTDINDLSGTYRVQNEGMRQPEFRKAVLDALISAGVKIVGKAKEKLQR